MRDDLVDDVADFLARAPRRRARASWDEVDGLDQRAEDRALGLVVFVRSRSQAVAGALAAAAAAARRGSARLDGAWERRAAGAAPAAARACARAAGSAILRRRLPNIVSVPRRRATDCRTSVIRACSLRKTAESRPAFGRLDFGAPGQTLGRAAGTISAASRPARPRRSSGRCWPRCRRAAASNGMIASGSSSSALAKSAAVISGRFGTPTWLSTARRRSFGRAAAAVDQVLGVAQIGKVGRGDDHDLVGADQRPPRPAGPRCGTSSTIRAGGAQQRR